MILQKVFWKLFGKIYNVVSVSKYMKSYTKYLRKQGVIIQGEPNYISPDAYFDSHDFSKIFIGNGSVISKDVLILTHDYSIARAIQAVAGKSWDAKTTPHFLKPVTIGENCFIGARSVLLGGVNIGKNSIVGAGAVVRGDIPENSIVIGNPAMIIAKTDEWAKKHLDKHDYLPSSGD